MRLAAAILFAALANAQSERPPGFVRGIVTTHSSSEFAVLTQAGDLYQYRTDSRTWIERDRERIRTASLIPGEILEVVSDRDPDPVRYARLVHVIPRAVPKPLPVSAGGQYRLLPAAPLRTLAFTGLIVNRDGDHIIVRTRLDGDKTIYLHPDTQYLNDGVSVNTAVLRPLTHVYVVAVENPDRQLEAHQIVWGAILEPEP